MSTTRGANKLLLQCFTGSRVRAGRLEGQDAIPAV